MTTLLNNALIINEGETYRGWVLIDGAMIADTGRGDAPASLHADNVIDLDGKLLMPGAIDTHVHFREPGLTHKATIASESVAAVAGGVTSFLEMPNTIPAATTIEAVEEKQRIADATSHANHAFFIGATNSNLDTLLSADYTHIPGIKLFMGSSTGNMLVDDDSTIARLFAQFKGVIAVHAEDESTIRTAREAIRAEYGDDAPVALHHVLRSTEACVKATRRAVALAKKYDTRLHVLHISTADELDMFSPGSVTGKRITAETCPHYLTFECTDLAHGEGYLRKCNPAVKTDADRRALIEAVADGRIDTIATDHAPHLRSEKEGSLFKAASGMPGIKFMLPVMLTLADDPTNGITAETVVEKCCHNPASLYGIDRRGFIRPGYYADLTVVEKCAPHSITHADALSHLSQGMPAGPDWTPYAGHSVTHRIAMTIVNGAVAFDGTHVSPRRSAMQLRFK